jgi:hypothetical protein
MLHDSRITNKAKKEGRKEGNQVLWLMPVILGS